MVLFVAFLATRALVGGGESPPAAPHGAGGPAQEAVFAVRAEDVSLGANRATLRAFGEVVAVDAADLRVASPGQVVAVHEDLAVGNVVPAGAPLVTIDPFAYEGALREARAQLAEARARRAEVAARIALEESAVAAATEQRAIAERDLERAETLVRSGTITDKALDERRLLLSERTQAVDQRRYSLEAERARLAQQDASIDRLEWQVERAERALADTVLTAPFTGIVRAEAAEVGRLLSANDVAVSLVRADALDVRFVLSDRRYGRLLAGGPVEGIEVEVIWRIGDTPLTYTATVTRIAADIAADTGGIDLYARLALPEAGPVPRPGAFVEVRVPGPEHARTVRLPASALYGDGVYVIGADDRLERRAVQLRARDGDDVILAGGLADGDAVITTRLAEAGAGIKVNRVEEDGTVPTREALAEAPAAAPEAAAPVPARSERRPRRSPSPRERS